MIYLHQFTTFSLKPLTTDSNVLKCFKIFYNDFDLEGQIGPLKFTQSLFNQI